MSFINSVRRAISLPPHILLQKIGEISIRIFRRRIQRRRDANQCTYSMDCPNIDELFSYFSLPAFSVESKFASPKITANYALNHRFDILGSGWVEWSEDSVPNGVDGICYVAAPCPPSNNRSSAGNSSESSRISALLPPDYKRIDWQRDMKSGWRWDGQRQSRDIYYGDAKGADIKIPWELARMHWLVHLALCATDKNTITEKTEECAREFRNQILDFISANPPRFGVNWMTSMEAAIRICNWLVAFDIFRSVNILFDKDFLHVFYRSVYEHGKHIFTNLEWSPTLRGNHYLANIAGLLYCAAYLPNSEEIAAWLAFSAQELSKEMLVQFFPDGGNFEASIPYHRLSLEIAAYSVILIDALPLEKQRCFANYKHSIKKGRPYLQPAPTPMYSHPFDKEQQTPLHPSARIRLGKAAYFAHTLCSYGAAPPQVGDNDSGRLLKLTPTYSAHSLEEELPPDFRSVLAVLTSSIENDFIGQYKYFFPLENRLALSVGNRAAADYSDISVSELNNEKNYCRNFPDFGLYVKMTPEYCCVVRAGTIGQHGKGGHAHNDQLSMTLSVQGKEIFADFGTYCYTSFWELRNRFRSTSMHNTLAIVGKEQNLWAEENGDALFWMLGDRAKAATVSFDEYSWEGVHHGYAKPHIRQLKFSEKCIEGKDRCEIYEKKTISFHVSPYVEISQISDFSILCSRGEIQVELIFFGAQNIIVEEAEYSPNYGIKKISSAIRANFSDAEISWKLSVMQSTNS